MRQSARQLTAAKTALETLPEPRITCGKKNMLQTRKTQCIMCVSNTLRINDYIETQQKMT